MPVFTIPASNGEDSAPAGFRLIEFNKCHNPKGPGGGQFCSAPDAGSGGGAVPKPRQPIGRAIAVSAETHTALREIQQDDTILDQDKPARLFAAVQRLQPDLVAEVEAVQATATRALPEFQRALSKVATDLNFSLHNNIESREVLDSDTDWVVVGGVKGVPRASVKAVMDYNGDVSKVKDFLRATITTRSATGMVTALERLSRVAQIVHIQDNVTRPSDEGYRDLNILIRMPESGLLAEVQIISKPMLRAKMTVGHRLYEAWRVLVPSSPRAQDLSRQMSQLYNGAWASTFASATIVASLGGLVSRLRGS